MLLQWRRCALGLVALAVLTACAEDDTLQGERIPLRENTIVRADIEGSQPVVLPQAQLNDRWTHAGGTAAHSLPHPALGDGPLQRVWSARVGPIQRGDVPTSEPVIGGGRIFTLAGNGILAATRLDGRVEWTRALVPEPEANREGFGGGVALGETRLYVTTGFGEVYAVDPDTGETIWVERFDAPFRSAPTFAGNRVIVRNQADRAFGLDAGTGRQVWQVQGAVGSEGTASTAPAALVDGVAIIPFSSGEVIAVTAQNGRQRWATNLGTGRRDLARGVISDITAGPVVSGIEVFVGNQTGSILALDGRTADRRWLVADGAQDAVTLSEDSVFVMTDNGTLTRLSRLTGEVIWSKGFPTEVEREARRPLPVLYHGPILAGGRLLLASTVGPVYEVAPEDGEVLATFSLDQGAVAAPSVAGGVVYILSTSGLLFAYN